MPGINGTSIEIAQSDQVISIMNKYLLLSKIMKKY
jgi:hypothetical protein